MKKLILSFIIGVFIAFSSQADEELNQGSWWEQVPTVCVPNESLWEYAKRKEMHEAQKELHQNLKEASKEEREVLITAFKEANKAKHEEIKTQAKEVKEEIRSLVETEATRTSDL